MRFVHHQEHAGVAADRGDVLQRADVARNRVEPLDDDQALGFLLDARQLLRVVGRLFVAER
jgi:hypothetical protein